MARGGGIGRGQTRFSDKHDLKGTLSFVAGSASGGFGSSSDMNTGFSVERSLFSSGTVALQGNVGYNGGSPNTVLRASYSHTMAERVEAGDGVYHAPPGCARNQWLRHRAAGAGAFRVR